MNNILMMILPGCPHCRKALDLMEELKRENPAYCSLAVRIVDEKKEPDFADSLDYWFVPAFFVDNVKIMEGVPDKVSIRQVFDTALESAFH